MKPRADELELREIRNGRAPLPLGKGQTRGGTVREAARQHKGPRM